MRLTLESKFEVWCGSCGAPLCINTEVKEDPQGILNQVHVEPCATCLLRALDLGRRADAGNEHLKDAAMRVVLEDMEQRHLAEMDKLLTGNGFLLEDEDGHVKRIDPRLVARDERGRWYVVNDELSDADPWTIGRVRRLAAIPELDTKEEP